MSYYYPSSSSHSGNYLTTPPSETPRRRSRQVSRTPIYSSDDTPESWKSQLPTPIKSPVRHHGPVLLPRIRSQDQHLEPTTVTVAPPPTSGSSRRHRTALGATQNPPATQIPSTTTPTRAEARRRVARRSASPLRRATVDCELISPVSQRSHHSYRSRDSSRLSSPIALSSAAQATRSRHLQTAEVNEQVLGRYGYPTYRQMPTYMTPAPAVTTYAPSYQPGPAYCAPTSLYEPTEYSLPTDLQYHDVETATTTLLDYLTTPNPFPELVRQVNMSSSTRASSATEQPHFWWDIRNLRSWSDFSLETMKSYQGFWDILNVEVPTSSLPAPRCNQQHFQPETESSLHELCREFYGDKINHALKVSQYQRHMKMRAEPQHPSRDRRRSSSTNPQPHFVSSYPDDAEKTILGDAQRGRVVGLVKSFNRWNTGMRAEAPHKKVEYLWGLAHLHRHMREHGCRYGFIITEIELVCVRAGVEDVPDFGYLELSPVIELGTSGPNRLTALLALWYLHMLAKQQPLPGQPGCRVDVGGPVACTRQKCLDQKDHWIPATSLHERREARRTRGWIFNTDPLSRKELPNRRKNSH